MQQISDHTLKMGTDFEVIVARKSGWGHPATLILPNNGKDNPLSKKYNTVWSDSRVGYNMHNDGRQLEASTIADTCREYIQDSCWYALKDMDGVVKDYNKDYEILPKPALKMSLKTIDKGGPTCIESGCNPDIDGYSGMFNAPNMTYATEKHVFAGMHLHYDVSAILDATRIGNDNFIKHFAAFNDVKLLDRLVTIPLMAMMPYEESAEVRRKFYGKAGCCRTKPYGREYRTLGSDVMLAPWCVSYAFGMVRVTTAILRDTAGVAEELFHICPDSLAQDVINNNKRDEAKAISCEIMRHFGTQQCSTMLKWTRSIIGIITDGIPIVENSWQQNWNIEATRAKHGDIDVGWEKGVINGKYRLEIAAAAAKV